MFSLSGPCELLFLLCFIVSCAECNFISLYLIFPVALLMNMSCVLRV